GSCPYHEGTLPIHSPSDLFGVSRVVAWERYRHAQCLAVVALAALLARDSGPSRIGGAAAEVEVRGRLPGLRRPHRALRSALLVSGGLSFSFGEEQPCHKEVTIGRPRSSCRVGGTPQEGGTP